MVMDGFHKSSSVEGVLWAVLVALFLKSNLKPNKPTSRENTKTQGIVFSFLYIV